MRRQTITRRFKTNTVNRAKARKSSSNGVAISENRGSNDQNDMRQRKRVKFTLPEQTQPQRTDAPKTSEFAFFKKLKEGIGGYYSLPLSRDDTYQSMTAKVNDRSSTETSTTSSTFKYTNRNLRSSLQSESQRPTDQLSFLSPPVHTKANDVLGLHSKDDFRGIKQRSSSSCTNVTLTPDAKNLVLSPFAMVSDHSGAHKDPAAQIGDQYGSSIFSVKRQKLRQLVAANPLVGQYSSNRFDLISVLLTRLFPNGNERECCQYTNSKEGVLGTKYNLAAVPVLDAEEETYTRNTTEFEYISTWTDDFPEYWSDLPTERVLPKWDVTTSNVPLVEYTSTWTDDFPEYWSDLPTKRVLSKWDITTSNIPLVEYNAETDFQDEEVDLNRCLDGKAMKNLFGARDSSYYLSSYNYESVGSGHLQGVDEVHNSKEHERREPRSLLLWWDADEEKEQSSFSALATTSGVAYQQIFDDSLDAINMDTTSFLCSAHALDSNLLSCTQSTGSGWLELGRNDRQDDCAVVPANQFRSFNPQYFIIAEHWETDLLEKDNVGLDCQHHPWFTSEESVWKSHSEAHLDSGGQNDDLGWKCSSLSELFGEDYSSNSHIFHFPSKENTNSFELEESGECRQKQRETIVTFSEGAFDIPNWFSTNLHTSLDKQLGHSRLLDNSGRVRCEEEIHSDDDDQWKSP